MRIPVSATLPATMFLLAGLIYAPPTFALGRAPSPAECKTKPSNPVIQGGCLVINKRLGNCVACHVIAGTSMDGNVGPALHDVQHMVSSKQVLFEQIWNPEKRTPNTAMPPFGKNRILTRQQITKIVDFLWTI